MYYTYMKRLSTTPSGKTLRDTVIMAKRCERGKSCGSTCINAGKTCDLRLTKFDKSFDLLSDRILSRGAVLNTPEAAVRWLESNKDRLASYGGGGSGDPKGDVLVLAIEPGDNPKEAYYDDNKKLLRRLEGLGADPVLKSEKWEDWYDRHPLVFANDIRQKYLVSQAAKTTNAGAGGTVGLAANVALGGMGAGHRQQVGNYSVDALRKGSTPFRRKLGRMMDGAGSSVLTMNISPFGVPSDKYWPFNQLPFKKDSVFRDRKAWLDYAAKGAVKSLNGALDSSPRRVVYVAANTKVHKSIFQEMAKEYGQPIQTKVYNWSSEKGNSQRAEVNMFTTTRKGNKIVIIQTNHPSWVRWPESILDQINGSLRAELNS